MTSSNTVPSRTIVFKTPYHIVVVEAHLAEEGNWTQETYTYTANGCSLVLLQDAFALSALKSNYFKPDDSEADRESYIIEQTVSALMKVVEDWKEIDPKQPNQSFRTLLTNLDCHLAKDTESSYGTFPINSQQTEEEEEEEDLLKIKVAVVTTNYNYEQDAYLVFKERNIAAHYVRNHPGCSYHGYGGIAKCPVGHDLRELNAKEVYSVNWINALDPMLRFVDSSNRGILHPHRGFFRRLTHFFGELILFAKRLFGRISAKISFQPFV